MGFCGVEIDGDFGAQGLEQRLPIALAATRNLVDAFDLWYFRQMR